MGSTRQQLIADRRASDGWCDLVAAGPEPDPDVSQLGECMLALGHLSDTHICDAESPVRFPFVARYDVGDGRGTGVIDSGGSMFRPQELLTAAVAMTMVDTFNAMDGGPVGGRPLDAVTITGDLTDNAQSNEADWLRTIMAGGSVTTKSGDPDRSEWVGSPDVDFEPIYYHPEPSRRLDAWGERLQFPRVEGLIAAAAAPIHSAGMRTPTYLVHGNHDALIQGSVAPSELAEQLVTGDTAVASFEQEIAILTMMKEVGPGYLCRDQWRPRRVQPDPGRSFGAPCSLRDRYDQPVEQGPANAWTTPVNDTVRLVSFDTVNPHGGWQGSVGGDQLTWFREVMRHSGEPYVVAVTHHPSWCLINDYRPAGTEPRALAHQVLGVLLDEPRVIAWLAGHVHSNRVIEHRDGDRTLVEITSASLVDWPQQARVLEIFRGGDGVLSLVSTAIDHDAPIRHDVQQLDRPADLAAISRAFARNTPSQRRRALVDASNDAANRIVSVPDPARA